MSASTWRGQVLVGCLVTLLAIAGCARGEGGVPGQLSQAAGDGGSAVISAAYGLQLWRAGDATTNQTTVLLGDAAEQVIDAYTSVAELDVDDRRINDSLRNMLDRLTAAIDMITRSRQVVGGGPILESDGLIAGLRALGDEFSTLSETPVPP